MNKKILIISCIFFGSLSFAQTSGADIKLNASNNIQKVKTLKIDISGSTLSTFESLKEELVAWNEKVYSVDINESSKEFTLTHFYTLDNRELYDVLNKYNVQKNSIISYK